MPPKIPPLAIGLQYPLLDAKKQKAPQTLGLRGFLKALLDVIKPNFGGNGGIRTLDEALHPILP